MKNKGDGFYPDYVYDRKKCPNCKKKGVIKSQYTDKPDYRCMYCKKYFSTEQLNQK